MLFLKSLAYVDFFFLLLLLNLNFGKCEECLYFVGIVYPEEQKGLLALVFEPRRH